MQFHIFNTKNIVDQYNRENYFNLRYKTNFECSSTDLGMIDIQPQIIKGANKKILIIILYNIYIYTYNI